MIEKITIRIVAEHGIVDPDADLKLTAGTVVEVFDTPYWRRRMVKGDVVLQAVTAAEMKKAK